MTNLVYKLFCYRQHKDRQRFRNNSLYSRKSINKKDVNVKITENSSKVWQ